MRIIFSYIRDFFIPVDKRVLLTVSFFTAVLVYINYHYGLDEAIRGNSGLFIKWSLWYILFLTAFVIPYGFTAWFERRNYFKKKGFIFLLFTAPVLFAFKLAVDLNFNLSKVPSLNLYWNYIIYWPLLLMITGLALFILWNNTGKDQSFYGLQKKGISFKPYFILLLLMIPLVAAASTQPDFLEVYPKLKSVTGLHNINAISWWKKFLFELSYGSDFINIELFFRGFLILAFVRWVGKDAILPMACFYCTIHFGKPLGECISSYFGGMILGIVVYNTRSIYGGLMVHLGIAWLMELGGYLGNLYF
jgi:hypothetical protein